MVTQLLDITIVPLEYQLQITNAKLESNPTAQSFASTLSAETGNTVASTQSAAQSDSYQGGASSGNGGGGSQTAQSSQGSVAATDSAQAYAALGQQQIAKTDGTVAIPDSVRQKMFSTDTGSSFYTAFMPSGGSSVSWQPIDTTASTSAMTASVSDVVQQQAESDTQTEYPQEPQYNYIPGEVHLEILQQARVEVEYTGGPRYYPPMRGEIYQSDQMAG